MCFLTTVYDLLSCCRNAYSIIFTHLSYFSHEYFRYVLLALAKRFSLFFLLSDFSFSSSLSSSMWADVLEKVVLIVPLRILLLFQVSFFLRVP